MNWIFLSPHFDDIALSCGGLVWELAQAGEPVSIWTVCAGDPPRRKLSAFAQAIHERWETGTGAVEQRRAEDRVSCAAMHASHRYINNPDCIYRPRNKAIPHYYPSGADLFGKVHPAERKNLVRRLSRIFQKEIHPSSQIVCPLTLGNHVDHQITRKAAEQAAPHFEQTHLVLCRLSLCQISSRRNRPAPAKGMGMYRFPHFQGRHGSLVGIDRGTQVPDQHLLGNS